MCPEKHFVTNFFFEKNKNLSFFPEFEWRISRFLAEVLKKGVNNKIHVTRGTFWKNFLRKKIQRWISSWFFWGNFDLPAKLHVRREGIPRDQLKVSGKNFREKPKILKFLWNELKVSVFWRNSFSRVVKTAFHVSREKFWEKWTSSRKKYDFEPFFRLWVKKFHFLA